MRNRLVGCVLLVMALALVLLSTASPQAEKKPISKAPDIIILSGNPMGGVKFRHILHTDVREIACETCHHASRPEMPASAPQQACRTCHTATVAKPMFTNIEAAFHNSTATAGLCIDCHRKENAEHKHKLAPVKCQECHSKANVLPDPTAGT
jgi:DNA-directed RNA polymerase subunit RPC12/RpoP